ncbi:MAG TPA: pyridoxal 5'-phosphate synthase [Solirubrobacterales bacterium]|nr:pyridoxal 5'-phosphate synthase [Solirubrobacterales bacterium]
MGEIDPLAELRDWIDEARAAGMPQPGSVAFVTVGGEGRPSARTVTLKRLEDDALVFTTALWTRKAREIEANPHVALLFQWPALGRQAHVVGEAVIAERALAEELFAERDLLHQLQAVVSRQGEPIDDLDPLRERLAHLAQVQETAPACPEDWGALRVRPDVIELWSEAPDRIHERRLFEHADESWNVTLLSP